MKYGLMANSIEKNIQELSEFLVDEFNIYNYYDLVEIMTLLNKFKELVIQKDEKLASQVLQELNNMYNEQLEN